MTKRTIEVEMTVLFAVAFVLAGLAGSPPAPSPLVVTKGEEVRNPTTEIAVGFGDVSHLSPWRLRRRFPRSVDVRGGQPTTLRDALDAINKVVAADDEMPEHTFEFAKDGSLASVCDVPAAKLSVLFDGADKPVTVDLLSAAVRDFDKVEFRMAGKAAARNGAGATADAASRKSGATKTITLPGGVTMEMIWCEPGSFMMGSPVAEEGRFDDEPLHPVTLTKGFWLGKYEVTQRQWQSVMGENPSKFKNPDRPVEGVSWEDCNAFISRLNVVLGGVARFPTEAEWEYACRAGSSGAVSGNGQLMEMAWYDANSGNETHDVGKNLPNAWGFYDMHGNVLEWCYDWFGKLDVLSHIDPKGPPTGSFRVLRGGCWFFYARDCRSAYRLKRDPVLRNAIYGFRLACSEK